MKVTLACNFERNETLGSSRVPLRLADELSSLGVRVSTVFSNALPRTGSPRLDEVSAPIRMAVALRDAAADADVVDIAGGDAWTYAWLRRWRRPKQRVVSRSNGLWFRALAAEPRSGRSEARRLASDVYQRQVLCRWERTSIETSDLAVFGASHDARDVVDRGWTSADRVAVVAPGVDAFFDSTVPLAQRSDVAFVGTMQHRKGSDILATAMSAAMAARPNLGLTLFGPGIPAEEALAPFDPAVRDRVQIVGTLPPAELARQMGHFAIFVFPTRYEGFGLVVLEAMRAGLAVIVTPTGAGVDVVRDRENGLLVPVEDPGTTAQAVLSLVDDPAFRVRLAAAGQQEAQQRSWKRTARELLAAYEEAISRPARFRDA